MDERHLNEQEAIDLIWKILKRSGLGSDPFSDDAVWFPNRPHESLVAKSDMFVSFTDAPPGMSPAQMAAKAITSSVSDFAAKGVRPMYCLISIAIPRIRSTHAFISSLAAGMVRAARMYSIRILGGDMNESKDDVSIDCSCFGFARKIVTRKGARKGNLIGVSGEFGLQAAGLNILLKGARAEDNFGLAAISSVMNPKAKLSFGLELSPYLTSSIDSSDGLAISLYRLAESSNLNFELSSVPISKEVKEFANQNALNAEDLALFGGEEYELVFTMDKRYEKKVLNAGGKIIGKVCEKTSARSRSLVFMGSREVERRGWVHNAWLSP